MSATRPEPRTRRRTVSEGTGTARRAEILAIAAQLFATRGFPQTTVRDIGDEAGILSGSLYHHFDSKEAMLAEILRDFMENLRGRFAEVVAQDRPPRARLDELVRGSFATIHQQPHAVALYQKESGALAGVPEFRFVGQISLEIEKMWVGVIVAGQQVGDFRTGLDPELTYRFIRDAVWTSVRWYRPRGRLRHDVVADQYLLLLHSGLLADDTVSA
ncbi:TetR family transcriptional regulator [Frankia sp. R43]|uniref:TetR/AcrR family transcriptional regulator n=1 Tax=Frankia sp. R43 TaxID=269536 RepID=UPI0006CA1ACC|nr:TetR/AcrR family transcriptional regulator [Frankia sp. R43]KPM52103.1 TetR family transcriptional regulator [Frankia sp. R43]